MRVAVLFVILAIAASINTQAKVNQLQACISEVQVSAEHIMNALNGVVTMDTLKTITEAVAAATEVGKISDACNTVVTMDAMMWIDQHTTDGQKLCVQSVLAMLLDIQPIKDAMNDPTKSATDKMKAFGPIVADAEKVDEKCIPAA